MNGGQIDFVADTSAIICLCRGDSRVEKMVQGKLFAITFVTMAELSLGVLKANNPEAAWSQIVKVTSGHKLLQMSTTTPALYARICFDLTKRGVMIPVNDIWIAAVAVEAGLPLLARDEHFSRINGLTVIEC